jgi:hypothetical protein
MLTPYGVQHGALSHACALAFLLCSYLDEKPPSSRSSITDHFKQENTRPVTPKPVISKLRRTPVPYDRQRQDQLVLFKLQNHQSTLSKLERQTKYGPWQRHVSKTRLQYA